MTPLKIAELFIEVMQQGDLDRLEGLLHADLHFKGPMLECTSAADYIAHLKGGNSALPALQILHAVESESECMLFYSLLPAEAPPLEVAQYFSVKEGQITATRLVFDTAVMRDRS